MIVLLHPAMIIISGFSNNFLLINHPNKQKTKIREKARVRVATCAAKIKKNFLTSPKLPVNRSAVSSAASTLQVERYVTCDEMHNFVPTENNGPEIILATRQKNVINFIHCMLCCCSLCCVPAIVCRACYFNFMDTAAVCLSWHVYFSPLSLQRKSF